MDIQGILISKLAEVNGISKNTGEPWKRATYYMKLAGSDTFVFDTLDGKKGNIAELDSWIGKKVVLHIGVQMELYNGKYFNRKTYFGGHIVEDDKATTGQANDAPAPEPTPATEAPAPAPTPEPVPMAGPAPEGENNGLPF